MVKFEIKSVTEILNEILLSGVQNGTITDINVGSVYRNYVENVSQQLGDQYTQLQNIYDSSRISSATEDDLDELGNLVGVTRKAGIKANGYVTFRRNSPPTSTFQILSGSVVSTQPNVGDVQRFLVTEDTNFNSSVTEEEIKFQDGNWYYPVEARFFQEGASNVSITATVSSVPDTTLVYDTDYEYISEYEDLIIDSSKTGLEAFYIIENCDTVGNWSLDVSSQGDTPTQNTTDEYEGTGAINLGKSGTSDVDATWTSSISAINITERRSGIYIDIDDLDTKNKIDNIKLYFGSSSSDWYIRTISGSDLSVGGKLYSIDFNNSTTTTLQNSPDASIISELKITINTKNSSDTFSVGKIIMDMWFVGTYEITRFGDVIHFLKDQTIPDNNTKFKISYKPESVEVHVEAESVGIAGNVSKDKIIYPVSSFPLINTINNYNSMQDGTDKETDIELRERIQNATELKGKATVESIKQAVLAVNGVASVTAEDTPRKTKLDEPFVYNASISKYKLGFEQIYLNSAIAPTNIHISDTTGNSNDDYTYGTDYVIAQTPNGIYTGEVEWLGASTPIPGNPFYVDYDYDWLGHIDLFISGATGTLPTSVVEDIETAIEDARSAGIYVSWQEPTIIIQNVTVTVTVDSDYTESTVKNNVQSAIETFLNTLPAGKDIYLAELYQIIMDVEGVENASITTPSFDISIDNDEVGKAGTITVN